MPCILCEKTLNIRPCEHQTGVVTSIEFSNGYSKIPYDKRDLSNLLSAFKKLNEYCPCMECLVKVSCCITRVELCPDYYERVKREISNTF